MTLHSRFALIVLGVVVFLVAAPLIIFFARGYSYDFEYNRIVKTGALTIKTDPRGAEIFLETKPIGTAPLSKRLLKPGEYSVEIKKPGFHPWRKQITIHPQSVTSLRSAELDAVIMLRENPIMTLVTTSTNEFTFAKSGTTATSTLLNVDFPIDFTFSDPYTDALLLGTSKEIWLYEPGANPQLQFITRSSENLSSPVYSHADGYVFFNEGRLIKAIEVGGTGAPNTYNLAMTETLTPKLAVSADGAILEYLDGSKLYRLNIR